ncbi:MAG: phage holin family protein [Thermodesulfobacteriota bacterium]
MPQTVRKPVPVLGGCLILAGFLMSGFFALALIGFLMDPKATFWMGLVVVSFIIGGLIMLWAGIKQVKKVKRMRYYLELIAHQGHRDVEEIAQIQREKDLDLVMSEIQQAINSGYLTGYRLDASARRICEFEDQAPAPPEPRVISFTCQSCGAGNQVKTTDGQARCEFCNMPYIPEEKDTGFDFR